MLTLGTHSLVRLVRSMAMAEKCGYIPCNSQTPPTTLLAFFGAGHLNFG